MKSYSDPERAGFMSWMELVGPERERLKKEMHYKAAVANPGVVAWYCATKLEMLVRLTCALISRSLQSHDVPGCADLRSLLQEGLTEFAGTDAQVSDIAVFGGAWGRVDDYWGSLEWSGGGMVHIHLALWIVGAPRIDKVVVPHEDTGIVAEEQWLDEGAVVLQDGDAAEALGGFFDRVYTEWNIRKPVGNDAKASAVGRRARLGEVQESMPDARHAFVENTAGSAL